MALSSMTGFARGQGVTGTYAWSWELKSVNAKGLDVRLRLPPGWDAVEVAVRKAANDALARGTVYGNLSVERKGMAPTVKINEPVLSAIIATLDQIDNRVVGAGRPTLDGILGLKGVLELSRELAATSERMREGKITPTDITGSTFSISSLGGIGGTTFTPIVNAPEVAILGAVRAKMQPVWDGAAFQPRLMLPLCLSYDHRAVDGAMAARFLRKICDALADVRQLVL